MIPDHHMSVEKIGKGSARAKTGRKKSAPSTAGKKSGSRPQAISDRGTTSDSDLRCLAIAAAARCLQRGPRFGDWPSQSGPLPGAIDSTRLAEAGSYLMPRSNGRMRLDSTCGPRGADRRYVMSPIPPTSGLRMPFFFSGFSAISPSVRRSKPATLAARIRALLVMTGLLGLTSDRRGRVLRD